jgi:sulfur carrier protein ThiS adenylyltransferase
MSTAELADRDIRQRSLVPPERLVRVHAVVIGVGAVGRQAALQLAALGVPKLTLVDFDTVEVANLAPQGFRPDDLGRTKVEAVAEVCHDVNPMLDLETVADRFRRPMVRDWQGSGDLAVFCCVDSIAARKAIWDAVRERADFWADARMSGEVVRVLACGSPGSDRHYATSLFSPERAFAGSCTAKGTIYAAGIAAGLMLSALAKWLRRLPVEPDLTLNLLAAEMTVVG